MVVFSTPCYFETEAPDVFWWMGVTWVGSQHHMLESWHSPWSLLLCLVCGDAKTMNHFLSLPYAYVLDLPILLMSQGKWVVLGFLNCTHGASRAECSLPFLCVTGIW